MGYSEQGLRMEEQDCTRVISTVNQVDLDDLTRFIPLPRGASTADAATTLMRALDRGELYRSNPGRKAKRARRSDRKRMQLGARQYGKAYYVPKKQFKYWVLLWWGTSLLFGAGQFLLYVTVCRWLELLP